MIYLIKICMFFIFVSSRLMFVWKIFKFLSHHSFNVSVLLKMGCTAPMFVLSFFLHSILFAGSALDSFQCLRSLLIVSFHVFFGLPRPRCPSTSNSVMLLIQPSFLTTCPNQRSRLYHNKVCMLLIPSFLRSESELMWPFKDSITICITFTIPRTSMNTFISSCFSSNVSIPVSTRDDYSFIWYF